MSKVDTHLELEEDDMPPPLDDMSNLVQHLEASKARKIAEPIILPSNQKPIEVIERPAKTTGMKKGFFNKGTSSSNSRSVERKKTDLPYVEPKMSVEDSLRFEDVQKSLRQVNFSTPEMLKSVTQRQELMSGMQNPRIMQAVEQFKTDPKGAMAKYKDDEEVRIFMQSFIDLCGNHLMNLGNQQQ